VSSNDAFFQRCRGLLSRLVSNAEYFFVAAAAEFPVAPLVDGPINNRINDANHKKYKDSPYLKPMLGPIGYPLILIRCVAALLAGRKLPRRASVGTG
jgi:hypothetical protein